MARALKVPQQDARTIMIFDGRWKYVRCEGFDPIMFDLQNDPDELQDLGRSADRDHAAVRQRMDAALLAWATQHHTRITATESIVNRIGGVPKSGILIGFWDEEEYETFTGLPFSSLKAQGRPS